MNKSTMNKLAMYKTIYSILNEHYDSIKKRRNYDKVHDQFGEKIMLLENYCVQLSTHPTRINVSQKQVDRSKAAKLGYRISKAISNYAKSVDNHLLREHMYIPLSELKTCSREQCINLLDRILLNAYAHVDAKQLYKVKRSDLIQLQAERDSLNEAFFINRQNSIERKIMQQSIKSLTRELDLLLRKSVDSSVHTSRIYDRELYVKYRFARNLVHYDVESLTEAKAKNLLVIDKIVRFTNNNRNVA